MVTIFRKTVVDDEEINLYECGGSLIQASVVLTAARCLVNKTTSEMAVRLGEWDTQTTDELYAHQDRDVSEMVTHNNYNRTSYAYNVGLMFLGEPVEWMTTVDTVCLPPTREVTFGPQRCFASGWGKDVAGEHGKYQVVLKKFELPMVKSHLSCEKTLQTTPLGPRFKVPWSVMCVGGEEGRKMCEGDAGPPLVCPIPGTIYRYYQAGIVSGVPSRTPT